MDSLVPRSFQAKPRADFLCKVTSFVSSAGTNKNADKFSPSDYCVVLHLFDFFTLLSFRAPLSTRASSSSFISSHPYRCVFRLVECGCLPLVAILADRVPHRGRCEFPYPTITTPHHTTPHNHIAEKRPSSPSSSSCTSPSSPRSLVSSCESSEIPPRTPSTGGGVYRGNSSSPSPSSH